MWGHLKLAAPLVCISCLFLAAPQQRKTVSVLVSVTDKQGAPVPNLKEADFTIREEGKPQTIRSLVRADASPLSIVLLIDKSGSTHDSGREVTKAVDASLQFFRAVLQPGRDKVALVTFNSVVAKDQDFSEDLPRLFQVLVGTLTRPSWGGTALHDAIFGASTLLEGRPGRRFILLVGDGVDNASRLSLPEVIKIIHTADIEIITIWMPSPGPPGAIFSGNGASQGRESLKAIAEETGGRYFANTEIKELAKFSQEVGAQYLMEYQSTNPRLDDKFRKIRVEPVNRNYKVRHRTGYWAN